MYYCEHVVKADYSIQINWFNNAVIMEEKRVWLDRLVFKFPDVSVGSACEHQWCDD